jgi:hypothetical protein
MQVTDETVDGKGDRRETPSQRRRKGLGAPVGCPTLGSALSLRAVAESSMAERVDKLCDDAERADDS